MVTSNRYDGGVTVQPSAVAVTFISSDVNTSATRVSGNRTPSSRSIWLRRTETAARRGKLLSDFVTVTGPGRPPASSTINATARFIARS